MCRPIFDRAMTMGRSITPTSTNVQKKKKKITYIRSKSKGWIIERSGTPRHQIVMSHSRFDTSIPRHALLPRANPTLSTLSLSLHNSLPPARLLVLFCPPIKPVHITSCSSNCSAYFCLQSWDGHCVNNGSFSVWHKSGERPPSGRPYISVRSRSLYLFGHRTLVRRKSMG